MTLPLVHKLDARPRSKPDRAGSHGADTREEILDAALREFSDHGFDGARMELIAARTGVSPGVIYYHFGTKAKLYEAVLERSFAMIRGIELSPDVDLLSPLESLRMLVGQTFMFHATHPEFVRIVMSENINFGKHLVRSRAIKAMSAEVLERYRRLIARGESAGEFRAGLDPVELNLTISSLCFYYISNRYTFSLIFEHDMAGTEAIARRCGEVVDLLESWCRPRFGQDQVAPPQPAPGA